ncbi:hypothetical protein B0H15DRAFT_818695 [Mycena belliarum]|uniref:Uncharacterized protein n=1 Tax=Mycena belliarum TaxID=1033014 RepID=A0AAD6UID4_9AGAR|nr:hypothetical protein B0H15DRAFT_818695 [Mycena belliae]
MHRATTLVLAVFFASLVAAAPIAPVSAISGASVSDVATHMVADIVNPLVDTLPAIADPSETSSSHPSEPIRSAEKSRRRSFRRRHP